MENYFLLTIGFVCTLIPTLFAFYMNERVKGSIKSFFDSKLEVIKKEHSKEIAQFQMELNHLKSKEDYKFTKLHEKRFEVLAKIYEHINFTIVATHNSITPAKTVLVGTFEVNEKLLLDEFKKVFFAFSEYYNLNKIYISLETTVLIDKYFLQSLLTVTEYETSKIIGSESVYNKLNEIIVPIKNQIENKFRFILGDKD